MQRKRCHDRHHVRDGHVRFQGGLRVLRAGESVGVLVFYAATGSRFGYVQGGDLHA